MSFINKEYPLTLKITNTLGISESEIRSVSDVNVVMNDRLTLRMIPTLAIPKQQMPTILKLNYDTGIAPINDYGESVMRAILTDANEPKVHITSTSRTVRRQAEIMYDEDSKKANIKRGKDGLEVMALRDKMKQEKKAKGEIMDAMEAKIHELGPYKVSNHLGDVSKLITLDIGKRLFKNRNWQDFTVILDKYIKKGVVKKYINETNAFHIEIII